MQEDGVGAPLGDCRRHLGGVAVPLVPAEAELGALEAEETILKYLDKAEKLLEEYPNKDGYYAFVCEKCASVFGYYGRFVFANELVERARRIYGQ